MAHRPLVLDVGRDSTSGDRGSTHGPGSHRYERLKSRRDSAESVTHHRMGWDPGTRVPPTGECDRRQGPESGERELSRPGHRGAELTCDVVPPAEHLVPDSG